MSLTTTPPKLSRRARLLVVDDEPVNLTVASHFCMMFGAEVDCASSGVEAIAHCAQSSYDLVLMDIRMPTVDGIEATASIRMLGAEAAAMPIIALTADVGGDLKARCASVGILVVLEKPLMMQVLFETVEAALQAGAQAPAPNTASAEQTKGFGGGS